MLNNKLCLLWQDVNTRNWFHVGNLTVDSDGQYSFAYENDSKKRGLQEAIDNSYNLHPTFPSRTEIYTSPKLFSAFTRRLPDKKRRDYVDIFNNLGVVAESNAFDMLSLTGGTINSDNYEFVRPIQIDDVKNQFEIDFYIRGWRHHGMTDKLIQSDKLILEAEDNNPYDEDAVYVLKNNDNKIGYVPAFYSSFIKLILTEKLNYQLDFEFNEKAPSHYKVKVYMSGRTNERVLSNYQEKIFLNC
ncbi:hypothetical protein CKN73_09040 [Carnobacterium divergens]|uniref:HIRAN domain-containing protein n=1 Tax=Carnobacterium divergens TaxID=2748 RepID=UPI001071CE90|nr:HIRAN domain-containing protein [Carnobacterium divergens]TFJ40447.1 hypothetical protein CKN77_09140 [Carnobacterium divergens]TFJ49067.1 hypothetical protein CKN73_09040 [Carnobacterium divergens]TFJ54331.1 hypothetical protein CKN83_08945 [Carnobacterium divergens]TFJ59857.1 hypothetical protein CKN89_09385 [Carnobacterium divergens]TFJ70501.1 hypothetical protein CKN91_09000 [Carnobacterium divergens]